MNYEPDDPRLTAYALNEVNDDERREIEAHLLEDPESRRLVDEIRQTSSLLSGELRKETAPKLHDGQRAAIRTVARTKPRVEAEKVTPLPAYRPFFAAAVALLMLSVTMFWVQRSEAPKASVAGKLGYATTPKYDYRAPVDNSPSESADAKSPQKIPMGVLEEFQKFGDHYETINIDNGDKKRAYGTTGSTFSYSSQDYAETSGGVGGAVLDDTVGVGSGGGWRIRKSADSGKATFGTFGMSEEANRPNAAKKSPPSAGAVASDEVSENQSAFGNPDAKMFHIIPGTQNESQGGFRYIKEKDPQQPLNPLGYAEPKRPQERMRYAPPQYQSYISPVYSLPQSSEEYARVNDNTFRDTSVLEHRLSTFSADVDTASYSNVRRFITQKQLPPPDAVRIEEMVNNFKYDYAAPRDGKPFNVFMELAQCPWNPNHKLARIGIKAAEIAKDQRPASNLVFLIDVSGSMDGPTRLPLVKSGLASLVENLNGNDHVSIVTYANGTTLALKSTPCSQKAEILRVIGSLKADGGTNGSDGIQQAYAQAAQNFIRGGVNRVILATDGDFNVGITDKNELSKLITAKAKEGVFLTVLGYGMGNLKDATLEMLANRGNGNYAYIDSDKESKRVLIDQLSGTLVTVAKDVKLQVEFNPARVRAHRLVGFENRALNHADFNNDAKDAGEIGAGHTVTALYEIVPTRSSVSLPGADPLRYLPADEGIATESEELLMLKIRYKLQHQDTSKLLEFPVKDAGTSYSSASKDFKFAAAVASFGMLLRGSPFRGNATFQSIQELASESVNGVAERQEFMDLVRKAHEISR